MTYEEYLRKLKELESEFEDKKVKLMKDFVIANNPYKIDDKVTDHVGSIIIKKIKYNTGFTRPCAVYTGLVLKKDGTPTKSKSYREVWQSNIITK